MPCMAANLTSCYLHYAGLNLRRSLEFGILWGEVREQRLVIEPNFARARLELF